MRELSDDAIAEHVKFGPLDSEHTLCRSHLLNGRRGP